MRALIVDDSSFIRDYLRQLLRLHGVECEEAQDGSAAISLLSRPDALFDLMLCDVNMPVMGGMECVRSVREQGLQPEMKVMMVTTEADHTHIHQALALGADEFLMKPFSAQSLREKLVLLGFALAA